MVWKLNGPTVHEVPWTYGIQYSYPNDEGAPSWWKEERDRVVRIWEEDLSFPFAELAGRQISEHWRAIEARLKAYELQGARSTL